MADIYYWHFLREDRRLRWGGGDLVEVGKTITFDEEPFLCKRGLHASRRVIDALHYAPGPIVTQVTLGGVIKEAPDKIAAEQRTVVWMADATEMLHRFIERLGGGLADSDAAPWSSAWSAAWGAACDTAFWCAARGEDFDAAFDGALNEENRVLTGMVLDLR